MTYFAPRAVPVKARPAGADARVMGLRPALATFGIGLAVMFSAAPAAAENAERESPTGTVSDSVGGFVVGCEPGGENGTADAGVDLTGVRLSEGGAGELVVDIFTAGDPAAYRATKPFSTAFDIAFIVGDGRWRAYDEWHDGVASTILTRGREQLDPNRLRVSFDFDATHGGVVRFDIDLGEALPSSVVVEQVSAYTMRDANVSNSFMCDRVDAAAGALLSIGPTRPQPWWSDPASTTTTAPPASSTVPPTTAASSIAPSSTVAAPATGAPTTVSAGGAPAGDPGGRNPWIPIGVGAGAAAVGGWAWVETMYRRGYTKGHATGADPGRRPTRGEFAVFLIRSKMNSVFPTVVSGAAIDGPLGAPPRGAAPAPRVTPDPTPPPPR